MKDKYSTNLHWDESDNCYIATCPEFPLLSAFGDTREEAIIELQVVLGMAIESYQDDKLELPKPKIPITHSGQFRLRIPKSLHKELTESAEKEGVSLNTYTISVITQNHALRKVYNEKTATLEKVVTQLTEVLLSQQNKLQIHSQRLDLIEINSGKSSLNPREWAWINDGYITQSITPQG